MENSLNPIWIYQEDELKFVNEAFVEQSGYTEEELLDMDYLDVIHPDFRKMVEVATEKAMEGKLDEIPAKPEFKILRKDGGSRWVKGAPTIINYDGERAILGTAIDITDRIESEIEDVKERTILSTAETIIGEIIREFEVNITSEELGLKKQLSYLADFATEPSPPENIFNFIVDGLYRNLLKNDEETSKEKIREILSPLILNFLKDLFIFSDDYYLDVPSEYKELEKKLSSE